MIDSFSVDFSRNCFRLYVSDYDNCYLNQIIPDVVIERCADVWRDPYDQCFVVYCSTDRDVLSDLLFCLDYVHYFDFWNL